LITRIVFGKGQGSRSSSLCSLLHASVTSSPLGPNILLYTLFSNTLNHVSHPHKRTGKIIVPYIYILILTLLDIKLEDKRSCTEW
jgi:hypothetical protein